MKSKRILFLSWILIACVLISSALLASCNDSAVVAPQESEEVTTLPETTEAVPAETENPFEGPKNVMIFGDSYSTFAGYIPDGYASWYKTGGREGTDVRRVTETWWYPLFDEMDYELVVNDSYSGSTLGYTGYNGEDCSNTKSFIARLERYKAENFFEKNDIDIIFVFGCTNDSWANAPLGEFKLEGIEKSDLYNVLPAIPYFIGELRDAAPDAQIVFIINTNELKPEIVEAIKKTSNHFGTKYVDLTRVEKRSRHPTVKGMESIRAQVKKVLK